MEDPYTYDDRTMKNARERAKEGRFQIGDLIMKRYKVLAELGQGGMGVVYQCFDETAGIQIALKALPPELSHNTLEMEEIKENFQLVHVLSHSNIAAYHNLERDPVNGNYYLIMACCEGEDLRHWIKRKRKDDELKPDDVLPIIKQTAEALDYAHEMKIIHRDIKPGNIMIDQTGKIKVLDFGLAAQIHTSMTRVSMAYHGTSGTGPYMAPEQWRGKRQDAAADQYALAVMAYEMLAGYLPFESADPAVLQQAVLTQTADEIPNIPKYMNKAILRAMSKNPEERFANCSDFVAALEGKKVKGAKKSSSGGGSFRKVAAFFLLLVILAGGAGYYFYDKQQNKTSAPPVKPEPPKTSVPPVNPEPPNPEPPNSPDERALAAFIQETYRLQARVLNKKANIDSLSCDRGQTFGKYLDALKENLTAGELAMKNNDVRAANSSLKNAEAAADWIIKNVPLRRQVQQLQKQVAEQKEKADKFNSSRLAFVAYRDAENLASSGNRDYESGKFASAENSLRSAISGYEKAYSEARKLTVDDLISSARTAGNSRNWERMQKQAEAALEIDSGNTEAQQLKAEAEKRLKPTLNLIATVDGVRVPAKIKFGNTELDTMKTLRNFRENADYKASLSYRSGEDEYVREIRFNCDWRGQKKLNVALTKQVFNGVVEYNEMRLEMVKIKAGTFMMGSPANELGRDRWEKQHQVTLSKDYWLGKYEVTQAQWQAVMGNNPSRFKGDNRPVEKISWDDAKKFCDKLNERYAGKLPRGYKFDLPTEAQWEYACRAGTTTALNSGEDMRIIGKNNSPNLDLVGWYGGNCGRDFELSNGCDISRLSEKQYSDTRGGTHPAGRKQPNNWGLYDMHGNVYEWCRDLYGDYSYGAVTDPVELRIGSYRVLRGGSWLDFAESCRSAKRSCLSPGDRNFSLGFRLALVPVQ